MITLVDSEGNKYKVERGKILERSSLLREIIEGEGEEEIPLLSIDSKTMVRILILLRLPGFESTPKERVPLGKTLSPSQINFFQRIPPPELVPLINSVNYLGMDDFINLCQVFIREMILGKTPEEVRHKFIPPQKIE